MGVKKNADCEYIYSEVFSNLSLWKIQNDGSQASAHINTSEESQKLEELIKRTLTQGEGNSALLIGPRGCGKSVVISAVIDKLKSDNILDLGLVVRLNGLLQTDDRLALKEMTKQLSINEEAAFKFNSFAENLNYILKSFMTGSRETSKPIVFILDEFDLFCHHHNQTLLYNLFDISQSSQCPICVIGVTSRLDVIELLEKRVKSRFSHRQIFLFAQEHFENYVDVAENILKITGIKGEHVKAWNKSVRDTFLKEEVLDILKYRFCLHKDFRNLKSFLLMVMAQISSDSPSLTMGHFKDAHSYVTQEAKSKVIESLSVLQLSLLIAMKHLHKNYDGEPFNFEMVYRQYSKFGERHSSMSSYERPVVFKAFDQLECLELIRSVDQSRTSTQREYRLMQLLVMPYQIDEAIQTMPNLPTFLVHWCSSNLD